MRGATYKREDKQGRRISANEARPNEFRPGPPRRVQVRVQARVQVMVKGLGIQGSGLQGLAREHSRGMEEAYAKHIVSHPHQGISNGSLLHSAVVPRVAPYTAAQIPQS